MGIQNPTQILPRNAPYPTGTPAELVAMGEDLREVFSCAIPHDDGQRHAIIKGCPRAGTCQKFFKSEKIGNFAPRSTVPGTPGQGPENVPFSLQTEDGSYLETYLPCHIFLSGPYGRMLASRNPEMNSAEEIHILGKAGEAKIMLSTTLPRSPRGGPRGDDMTLITTNDVIVVPKHKRPAELDPGWRMRQSRRAAEADEAVEDVLGVSAGEALPVGPVSDVQAAVESIPQRRKA